MSGSLDELRHRFQTDLQTRLPAHLDRWGWDERRIADHQRHQLRELLGHAIERSSFHARRLAGVDPRTFELDQLPSLPVMTKADMMAAFDDVVTDRRLSRQGIDAHLASVAELPMPLEGDYFVVASGGSSGLKGIFVYHWTAMVELVARIMASGGPPPAGRQVVAAVAAPSAAHATLLGLMLVEGDRYRVIRAPVTLPLQEIVRRLNDGQPDVLFGYPSVLDRLASEQRSGRLSISPHRIRATAEPLKSEAEAHISASFGVPVVNTFGASEGLVGVSPPGERAFTFASDLTILEPVDENNEPVLAGLPSARVLVTNLFNRAQPLIRYVLEDRFTVSPRTFDHATQGRGRPGAADNGHLVARVEGRSRVTFVYAHTHVHPLTVLAPAIEMPEVADYQIRQTRGGVAADVLANGDLDRTTLKNDLERALENAGLPEPRVAVRIVESLAADPQTGKVRRLIPLGETDGGPGNHGFRGS